MGYQEVTFPPNTTVLVTGAAGFIGSHLAEALLHKHVKVIGLDDFSHGKKTNMASFINHSKFRFIEADIREYDQCLAATKDVDFVLHQAAWGSVPRSLEMPKVYEEINGLGTLNIFEASRQNKVKRVVYASSSSVYGDAPNLPKIEGYEGRMLSPYALTKKMNEAYGKLYFDIYGLETVGLRYFNVFGKRQDPKGPYAAVIPKFIQQLKNSEIPTIYGDGTQSRDFTYIDNVIEANLKALVAPSTISGESFNVAYGARATLLELYDLLAQHFHVSAPPHFTTPRQGDIPHSLASIKKAQEGFDYQPTWSFEQGLKAYLKEFR